MKRQEDADMNEIRKGRKRDTHRYIVELVHVMNTECLQLKNHRTHMTSLDLRYRIRSKLTELLL